jgi:alpha-beta hydrolase superfamily lysophospholipase
MSRSGLFFETADLPLRILCTLLLLCCLSTAIAPSIEAQAQQPAPQQEPLPFRIWKHPAIPPRYGLLCIHGLGLYSNSYEDFAKRMIARGAIVYALDVRGFGAWMKSEGHAECDFKGCLEDIKTALTTIRQNNPGMPVFVLGESMGGAIALRAASMYPELMDGVISSAAAAERFKTGKTDLKVAFGILRGPRKDINIGDQIVEQAATATRKQDGAKVEVVNEQLQQDWKQDPLARMKLSPKELIQFQAFMNDNHDAVKKITSTPVLFVQGLDDSLVKPEGTFELVLAVGTPDRMFVGFPTRHLVFEETQTADPRINAASTNLVFAWIASHIKDMSSDLPAIGSPASAMPPQMVQGQPIRQQVPPAQMRRAVGPRRMLQGRPQLRPVGK